MGAFDWARARVRQASPDHESVTPLIGDVDDADDADASY